MSFASTSKSVINTKEVIFITNDGGECKVIEFNSGSAVTEYKGVNFAPKTLAFINNDFLIGAVMYKPLIYLSSHNNPNRKKFEFSMPGKVSVLILSNCGNYCLCAIGNLINVYMLINGDLICTINYHCAPITCMKLNFHDTHLVSGAEDGVVFVGSFPDLLSSTMVDNVDKFVKSWLHSDSVSDVVVSNTFPNGWIISCSHDKLIQIYDMKSQKIVRKLLMNQALTSILTDATDFHLYIGCYTGEIFKIYLSSLNRSPISYDEIRSSQRMRFSGGHRNEVTCLSLSFTDTTLASGSKDKTCKLWSVQAGHCLKTFSFKGSITNVCIKIRPCSLDSDKLNVKFIPSPFKKKVFASDDNASQIKLPSKHHFINSTFNSQEAEKPDRCELLTKGKIEEALQINHQLFTFLRMALENPRTES